ncbi:MAG: hypothetical protein IJ870_00515 [Alphaproteobacteria bacterium]|nr:hypothetical protein [Alphaproteobacteria bacterium]
MKIKIKKNALRIRQAYLGLAEPYTLKALKLTEAQAFGAEILQLSYKEAVKKFPKLDFGEDYQGYLAVWHGEKPEINYLRGNIYLAKQQSTYDYYYNLLVEKGLMSICQGSLEYVWNFNGCSSEMMQSVKDKLTEALVSGKLEVELSEEENKNLRSYLGGLYYQKFFTVQI